MTSDLVVVGNTTLARTTLSGVLLDSYGRVGGSGEVLTSTGTSTQWVTTGALPAGRDGSGFLVASGVPNTNVTSSTFYVDSATGDEYYNTGGASWTLLPSSDNQTLTASALSATNTMTLTISGGNSVTLDFSSLADTGTDSQTLAFGSSNTATQTTLEIASGNSLTLQASGVLSFTQTGTDTLALAVPQALLDAANTDSQTLTASALSATNTMTLAISGGNSVTLDFSSLADTGTDSQTLAFGSSNTATQTTLEIDGGNSLTLQASGVLSFSQTGTDTLALEVPQALLDAANTDSQNPHSFFSKCKQHDDLDD